MKGSRTARKTRPKSSPVAIVATSAVGLALSYSVVGMATFGLYVIPLSQRFGWGRGEISIAYTAMCYMLAVSSPLIGALMDRVGVRPVLLPSLVLFSIVYACLALQDGDLRRYYILYALLAVVGVGTAPPSYARVIVLWFEEHRGLALGLALSGVGIGTALLPLFMQHWIDRFGFQGGYVATAALVLCVATPTVWRYLREPPQVSLEDSEHVALSGLNAFQCLGQRAFWQMLLGFILLGLVTSGLVAHLVPLLRDRGITPEVAASALSILGVTMIVGRIATGALLDRFRAPPVVCACVLASTAGFVLLRLDDAHSGWAFAAVLLVGFTVGAELDFMSYLVSRYQGLKYFGRIYGSMYGVFILGSGIGPLIMGYAQQRTGSYQPAISGLIIASAIAAGLFATLGPYPDGFGAGCHERPVAMF